MQKLVDYIQEVYNRWHWNRGEKRISKASTSERKEERMGPRPTKKASARATAHPGVNKSVSPSTVNARTPAQMSCIVYVRLDYTESWSAAKLLSHRQMRDLTACGRFGVSHSPVLLSAWRAPRLCCAPLHRVDWGTELTPSMCGQRCPRE